ncbi:MAG: carbamoyltransferase HypF [Proteobacteria bacterium]|nr:carbamoyltransferase HypF [Pseudomonadota bacterium]
MTAPAIIATGAWLKNRACRLQGQAASWSPLHGDLGTPEACDALAASVAEWLAQGPVAAFAHDLHPDFASTHLAEHLAQTHGVPAIGVQHHHAHVAAVVAEHGLDEPVVGLALDGVGLGTDGLPWGGELLWVHHQQWQRLGHFAPLPLVGGDRAAREPWRMAAAVLQQLDRAHEIAPRYAQAVGRVQAEGVAELLHKDLRAPRTTSAGRWFDAAAAALGLMLKQDDEAQAAIALERAATEWLAAQGLPAAHMADARLAQQMASSPATLALAPLLATLFDVDDVGAAAARFHATLAAALATWAAQAAAQQQVGTVCLAGGCFYNRILRSEVERRLDAAGLQVRFPAASGCGDAGLALGQAWVGAHTRH